MKKKIVALITLLIMMLQLCTLQCVLANTENVFIDSVIVDYSDGEYCSTITVKGGSRDALAIVAAYDVGGTLVGVFPRDITFINNEATGV